MSFLQPFVLAGLALALLPVVIHLLNRLRHRVVEWGAMRFLVQASRRTRGHARLRHLLIMLMRMLAIAGLVLAVARPLSSGWVGSLNASVDTAVIVLDRSPSMAQQDLQSSRSSRSVGIQRVVEALEAGGTPNTVVLVDSGSGEARQIESLDELAELPEVGQCDAQADLSGMLQTAVEHLEENRAGRAEIWVCSDGQRGDWGPDSARWDALRKGLAEREESVRVKVLNFRRRVEDNLSVRVENLRRVSEEGSQSLLLDIVVRRQGGRGSRSIDLGVVLGGARSVLRLNMEGDELRLGDHRILLPEGVETGWGQIDLPEDENPRDNVFYFAYGPTPRPGALIVSEDPASDRVLRLLVAPSVREAGLARVARPAELSTVDWDEPALVLWRAPLPVGSAREDLLSFVDTGGVVLFLPPSERAGDEFLGMRWDGWVEHEAAQTVVTWRGDGGVLAHALDGRALPLGKLEVRRTRGLRGEATSLAELGDGASLLSRVPTDVGGVYFLSTSLSTDSSNLASQGIVMFVLVQRALEQGTARLASVLDSAVGAELADSAGWERVVGWGEGALSTQSQLVAGVYRVGDKLVARNRPVVEDESPSLSSEEISSLLEGVDHRIIEEDLGSDAALVQEIWRVFVGAMILALLLEAFLSLPRVSRS